jgi:hypothetical protein
MAKYAGDGIRLAVTDLIFNKSEKVSWMERDPQTGRPTTLEGTVLSQQGSGAVLVTDRSGGIYEVQPDDLVRIP